MKKYLDITTGKLNEVEDEEPADEDETAEDKPENRIIAINDDGLGSEGEEEADAYENVVRD